MTDYNKRLNYWYDSDKRNDLICDIRMMTVLEVYNRYNDLPGIDFIDFNEVSFFGSSPS